jgi:hypothetical protein
MKTLSMFLTAFIATLFVSYLSVLSYEEISIVPWTELAKPYSEGQNGDIVYYFGTIHAEGLITDEYIFGSFVRLDRYSEIFTYESLMREKEGLYQHVSWIMNPLTEEEYLAQTERYPYLDSYDFSYVNQMIPNRFGLADTIFIDHIEIVVSDPNFYKSDHILVNLENVNLNTMDDYFPTGYGLFKSNNNGTSLYNPSLNDYNINYYGILTGTEGLIVGIYQDGKIVNTNNQINAGFFPDYASFEEYLYDQPYQYDALPIIFIVWLTVTFVIIITMYLAIHPKIKHVLSTDKRSLLVLGLMALYYGLYVLFIWIETTNFTLFYTPIVLYVLLGLILLMIKSTVMSKEVIYKDLGNLNKSKTDEYSDEYKDFFDSYSEKK